MPKNPRSNRRLTLSLQGPLLTVIIALDPRENMICAFCPELDLAAESSSEAETLQDLLEAIRDYAEEYLADVAPRLNSGRYVHGERSRQQTCRLSSMRH